MSSQADLADRYGVPSPRRRRWLFAGALAGLAVVIGFLLWVAFFHGNPGATSSLVGYDLVDDHTVTARVQVTLRDDVEEADCLVRALSEDKAAVGELSFDGVDGINDVTIRTERRATAVEVVGCTVEGQNLRR